MALTDTDLAHLRRALALAAEALAAGDEPFGSVLVSGAGEVRAEARNEAGGGDHTRHPEFALARWAAAHLTPEERARATVCTSGEHCPMCAAAHGWTGLGRIVHAASAAQLAGWLAEWGLPPAPVAALPVTAVVPGALVEGPVPALTEEIRALHHRARVRP
ncbi:nucleoside deaminase [Streptomyces sp. SPB074]|uniref:nucleoside deaminase n=1 Tax=Streptomyces sp. (strain SPB074) TaxID=465543 RepID=UPI00017FEBE0|nr:nucleoside deaminase [Streptomyces sp. SPB074]EDY45266.1 cytidine/deoxycytidylate deaminase, zinc-binding region [Streptomyces sp. SPB074]